MSNKEQFIECISKMNTVLLEAVLVKKAFKRFDNSSFLEKLNEICTDLKASGNTYLKSYRGIGLCGCNRGKKIWCFVGNNTNDYFTLSYLENEHNYYNFHTTCSEVAYEETLPLNKFYYFSIQPENTSEYKKHPLNLNPIHEYKEFVSKSVCRMETIELWLEKYKNEYNSTVSVIEDKRNHFKLNTIDLLAKTEFEKLYGKLAVLRKLYHKESYFKEQLKLFNKGIDSISKQKEWFTYQEANKNQYELFSLVFYDNRKLTHFSLKLEDFALDPEDFKYTLKYMSIIEDAQATEFKGTIKSMSAKVHSKKTPGMAYSKREIVLSVDDFCSSEYQITFSQDRVQQLDNVHVGQYVKVLARLTGGAWEKSNGIKEFGYNLFGWHIEKLTPKPKTTQNTKETDLYNKYMLPTLF